MTTAIDPARRAAEGGNLRREELLQPALVTWWLEWDHHESDLNLEDLVAALQLWQPVIGRRRSANRGRAHVEAVHHRTVDLATAQGLTWWLGERLTLQWDSPASLGVGWRAARGTTRDEGREVLRQTFRVTDALHTGGEFAGAGVKDNRNRTRRMLPSASWRGVFRHRVGHIVRVTTGGSEAEAEERVAQVTARLFGTGREKGASDEAGYRGQLRFGDSEVHGALACRPHVAIDRVTGGAAKGTAEDPKDDSGLLFDVEYFGPGATLDLVIFNDSDTEVSKEDRALLNAVIRDIDTGVIGVGAMTSRGYGTLQIMGGGQ